MFISIGMFLLGIAVGSFLNAYIFRLRESTKDHEHRRPAAEHEKLRTSVWRGRSCCPKCKKPLCWYELVPLLSFAIQRGRCRGCKERIDWQYPLVELATGILFVLAFQQVWNLEFGIWNLFGNWKLVIGNLTAWYLLSVLVILFVYDLRFGLVPDRVVLPAIAIAFLYNVIASAAKQSPEIATSAMGGLAMTEVWRLTAATILGSSFFAAQYYLSKGRWLGSGDIRIGALMGAMVGWPLVIFGLALSYISGGAVAILLLASGKKRLGQTLPLGTFLSLGTAIVFLYGQILWQWYWGA